MTDPAGTKARDWLVPLALLWMGFAIAGNLLERLVPTTFLFLTWTDACRDSAIEECRLAMFALPALFLAGVLVIAAHAVLPRGRATDAVRRERNRRTFRAALVGATCFAMAASVVPFLPVGAWLPAVAAGVGSGIALLFLCAGHTSSARGAQSGR